MFTSLSKAFLKVNQNLGVVELYAIYRAHNYFVNKARNLFMFKKIQQIEKPAEN